MHEYHNGEQKHNPQLGQLGLFGLMDGASYPAVPGFQGTPGDTSMAAAIAAAVYVRRARRAILAEYRFAGDRGLTADECAALVGDSILATRPRITELKKLGYLVPSGEKRKNDSGLLARVMRATQKAFDEVAS